MNSLTKKAIALILSVILILPTGSIAYATNTTSNTDMSLTVEWEDSEFKNGTAFNIVEESAATSQVRMKVSYESLKVIEEGYGTGELVITVKGIGKVGREETIIAAVGADKADALVKERDWSYTYNQDTDIYTLTNNAAIEPNSVFTGYFEFVWNISARDSIHNYEQNDISAQMLLPDGSIIQTETLSFSNKTVADKFEADIEVGSLYSYEGLVENIAHPEDYAFVKYDLGTTEYQFSRGLKSKEYYFNPDTEKVGINAVVISPILTATYQNDGSYLIELNEKSGPFMAGQYLYVAYPISSYRETTINASFEIQGEYFEGDDLGVTGVYCVAKDTAQYQIGTSFEFEDIPGKIYDYYKDTYYDKYVEESVTNAKGGDIKGSAVVSGTTVTFYLEGLVNVSSGHKYTMEMVDDFLYIEKNNGQFRQLEQGEYEFKEILIPSTKNLININDFPISEDKYEVKIYAFSDGTIPKDMADGTLVPTEQPIYLTKEEQRIPLPDNTTAIAIIIEDITESIQGFSIPVKVGLHTNDTSDLSWEEQDNLTTGRVINTTFIKLYESGNWLNNNFTEDSYIDNTNLGLAEKDRNLYGDGQYYLDREKDEITLYAEGRVDYRAEYTKLEKTADSGNETGAIFTMGADFSFSGNEYPNKFSLYTILPYGYTLDNYMVEEDIWDIMRLSGLNLSETELAAACSPEVNNDYQDSDRTYIALHFDFGDEKITQKSSIKAEFNVKGDKSITRNQETILTKSCVMIDRNVMESSAGKYLDDGSWGDDSSLFKDIDRDGNLDETLSYDAHILKQSIADSSQLQLSKYVETSYSDGWAQLPDVPSEKYDGTYRYKLSLQTGSGAAGNLVITDILENTSNSKWKGNLHSVDITSCEEKGLTGTIYYSEKESPSKNLTGSDWTTTPGNEVKAIAIDFGDSRLQAGEEVHIILNMKAPEDTSLKGKVTENEFTANFSLYAGNTNEISAQDEELTSNPVQVMLTPPQKSIVVTKKDAEDKSLLSDAYFTLFDSNGNTIGTKKTNAKGMAVFHGLVSGEKYTLQENTAPAGYVVAENTVITLSEETEKYEVTILNNRKTGTVELTKTNYLNQTVPVPGAEYTIYDEEGNAIASNVTDENGKVLFNGLAWGTYTIKETVSPNGFELNETVYPVDVNRESVEKSIEIKTFDVQQGDVHIELTKYAADISGNLTEEKVPGAVFKLMYKNSDGSEKEIGVYTTDSEGKIVIEDAPYGEYYFKEFTAPSGYFLAEETESFTVSPEQKEAYATAYNTRKPGSILITKQDNFGNSIAGIEFTLYTDEELLNAVGTYTTDAYGNVKITGLEWGTYYLVETKAPDYYQINSAPTKVIINAENLERLLNFTNETTKGKVILTKYNEDETQTLSGAEYTLYNNDGTIVDIFTTDENGRIIADGLEWGSYYFKETKAPEFYTLSDEMIRFSVNSSNSNVTQKLSARDAQEGRSITITKKILASDINFANGSPTFIFKVTGSDAANDVTYTYYRMTTFGESFVANNVDADGYVSQTVTVSGLDAGNYTVCEEKTGRYSISEITDVIGGTITGKKVHFDLQTNDEGSVTFTNEKYENQGFSDNQSITNIVKKGIKLTAITAEYSHKEVQAGTAVDKTALTVKALFNDGSTNVLNESDYSLSLENFPSIGGEYTITVTYEHAGVIRTADFTVSILSGEKRIVDLIASVKPKYSTVELGTELTSDMFNVEAVYNNGETKELLSPTIIAPPTQIHCHNCPPDTVEGFFGNAYYPGASALKIVFDEKSELEYYDDGTNRYYIDELYIYGEEETYALAGDAPWIGGLEVIMPGTFADFLVTSDSNDDGSWGFEATVYPLDENGNVMESTGVIREGNGQVETLSLSEDNPEYEETFTFDGADAIKVELVEVSQFDMFAEFSFSDGDYEIWNNFCGIFTGNGDTRIVKGDSVYVYAASWDSPSSLEYKLTPLYAVPEFLIEPASAPTEPQQFDVVISLNPDLFEEELSKTITLTAKEPDPILISGYSFRNAIPTNATTLIFTDEKAPAGVTLRNLDTLDTGAIVGWVSGNTYYVSTQREGEKVFANPDSAEMFADRYYLFRIDAEMLDTSKVTSMYRMFANTGKNQNKVSMEISGLETWDTSNVYDTNQMFYYTGYNNPQFVLEGLEKWDFSNLRFAKGMFQYAGAQAKLWDIGNISTWRTPRLENISNMFDHAGMKAETFTLDLSNWITKKVEYMNNFLYAAGQGATSFNVNMSGWEFSSLIERTDMFTGTGLNATSYILDVSDWNLSEVKDISYLFAEIDADVTPTIIGIEYWDTKNLENISYLFYNTLGDETPIDLDLSTKLVTRDDGTTYTAWDVSNLINAAGAFQNAFIYAETFELDVSNWNSENLTDGSYMFHNTASNTKTFIIKGLNDLKTSKLASATEMFSGAGRDATTWDIGNLSTWETGNLEQVTNMFYEAAYGCTSPVYLDVSNWKLTKIGATTGMFQNFGYKAESLRLNVSYWDFSNVQSADYMLFGTGYEATKVEIIGLETWNTSNLVDGSGMFNMLACDSAEFSIGDISNWNVSKLQLASDMFYATGRAAEYSLDLSRWNVSNVTNHLNFAADVSGIQITEPNWVM